MQQFSVVVVIYRKIYSNAMLRSYRFWIEFMAWHANPTLQLFAVTFIYFFV